MFGDLASWCSSVDVKRLYGRSVLSAMWGLFCVLNVMAKNIKSIVNLFFRSGGAICIACCVYMLENRLYFFSAVCFCTEFFFGGKSFVSFYDYTPASSSGRLSACCFLPAWCINHAEDNLYNYVFHKYLLTARSRSPFWHDSKRPRSDCLPLGQRKQSPPYRMAYSPGRRCLS